MKTIEIKKNVLEENSKIAAKIRERLKSDKTLSVNFLSSPGSGKTTLLEKILPILSKKLKVCVLEGDVFTDEDAKRIKALNIPCVQIETKGSCHLDAPMILRAYETLNSKSDILIIENVGNLVCPSSYDLGEDFKISLVSVAEGDEKPLKYPSVFRNSKVLLITKTDLLKFTNFDIRRVKENALKINPDLKIFEVSSYTGEGIPSFAEFLKEEAEKKRCNPSK